MLSLLDCLTAKPGGAVNGCAYAPFILTVDWLGWVCYLPDKLEFILSYHVLFSLCLAGNGPTKIARMLTEQNIPTPGTME